QALLCNDFYIFADYFHPIYSSFGVCFYKDPAPAEIYTLSLHDALPIFDEHQVHAERLAYTATEAAAAEALAAYARERAGDETTGRRAAAFAGEVASWLGAEIEGQRDDFGVTGETLARTLGAPEVLAAVRAAQHEARLREIGREIIRTRGANNSWIDGDLAAMARDSARSFARKEVAPIAERIHRHDEL